MECVIKKTRLVSWLQSAAEVILRLLNAYMHEIPTKFHSCKHMENLEKMKAPITKTSRHARRF